jgi:hypothetical protein
MYLYQKVEIGSYGQILFSERNLGATKNFSVPLKIEHLFPQYQPSLHTTPPPPPT